MHIFIFFLLSLILPSIAIANVHTSLGQAVDRVKQQHHGKIISATTRRDNQHRNIHNIRVLTPHGQVKRYQINEENGHFVQPKRH